MKSAGFAGCTYVAICSRATWIFQHSLSPSLALSQPQTHTYTNTLILGTWCWKAAAFLSVSIFTLLGPLRSAVMRVNEWSLSTKQAVIMLESGPTHVYTPPPSRTHTQKIYTLWLWQQDDKQLTLNLQIRDLTLPSDPTNPSPTQHQLFFFLKGYF